MRAYLDDEPLELEGQTLGAAVLAGRQAAESRGRMIIEVWADGAPAPPADLEELPDADPYAGEVRFVSAVPGALVAHALEEAADNLAGVRAAQTDAAAQLSRGETREAMTNVGEALRAWEIVRRAVQEGCAVLGVAPAELLSDEESRDACTRAIESLLEALREVQRAVGDQDVASLADTLAYDLDELAETWTGLLSDMASAALATGNGE